MMFMRKIPALSEISLDKFLQNFTSIDEMQRFLVDNSHINLPRALTNKIKQVQESVHQFLHHVLLGDLLAVERILKNSDISCFLLKLTGRAMSKFILKTGRSVAEYPLIVEGTALQIALGAADVAGQRLIMKSIDAEKLCFLLDDVFYEIKCGDGMDELNHADFNIVKSIFTTNNNVNLICLSEQQLPAYSALLKAVEAKGYQPKQEMVEMLQRYLKLLPDGELEIATQTIEQFPPGWESAAAVQHQTDLDCLKKSFDALITSNLDDNADLRESDKDRDLTLNTAYEAFKIHVAPNTIIKTGFHFNASILIESFVLGNRFKSLDFCNRGDFFYERIIGFQQGLMPRNFAMIQINGLNRYIGSERNEYSTDKIIRSLYNIEHATSYFKNRSRNRYLGFNMWIDCFGYQGCKLLARQGYGHSDYDLKLFLLLWTKKSNAIKLLRYRAQQLLTALPQLTTTEQEPTPMLSLNRMCR